MNAEEFENLTKRSGGDVTRKVFDDLAGLRLNPREATAQRIARNLAQEAAQGVVEAHLKQMAESGTVLILTEEETLLLAAFRQFVLARQAAMRACPGAVMDVFQWRMLGPVTIEMEPAVLNPEPVAIEVDNAGSLVTKEVLDGVRDLVVPPECLVKL
jgi:hypothetical protein